MHLNDYNYAPDLSEKKIVLYYCPPKTVPGKWLSSIMEADERRVPFGQEYVLTLLDIGHQVNKEIPIKGKSAGWNDYDWINALLCIDSLEDGCYVYAHCEFLLKNALKQRYCQWKFNKAVEILNTLREYFIRRQQYVLYTDILQELEHCFSERSYRYFGFEAMLRMRKIPSLREINRLLTTQRLLRKVSDEVVKQIEVAKETVSGSISSELTDLIADKVPPPQQQRIFELQTTLNLICTDSVSYQTKKALNQDLRRLKQLPLEKLLFEK